MELLPVFLAGGSISFTFFSLLAGVQSLLSLVLRLELSEVPDIGDSEPVELLMARSISAALPTSHRFSFGDFKPFELLVARKGTAALPTPEKLIFAKIQLSS
jgi:hypothetical protein